MRKPTFCTDVTVAEMASANQSLEVCGESRMDRVRRLLSSPLSRRKSGTLALGIFGAPLDSLSQQGSVPFVVVRLCQYIENTGMAQEGLFRVSGNARLVDKLRWSFDQSGDAPLEAEGDVAVAAALLKLLFRELPEPLVPMKMHRAFLDAVQTTVHDRGECTRRLKCLVEQLPPNNFAVLKYLCHFLSRVAQLEEHTRMTPSALGIVFGPNLFRFAEDLQGLKEQAVTNQVVTYFIDHYHSIFEGDAELSCTADTSMSVQSSSASTSGKCSRRVISGISAASMQPLTVVIPPLDETMLALKQDALSEVPTLMIDSLIDDRCSQAVIYRVTKEGGSGGAPVQSRSCKRKERRISGEDPVAPRSSSEERPAAGLRVEPELASRRCSSHEEVTTLEAAQGYSSMVSGGSGRPGAPGEDPNRDLSPHPPQPKRREIETPSSPCPDSSQEWHEACRSVERPNPRHLQDVQYQDAQPMVTDKASLDQPLGDAEKPFGPTSCGREAVTSPEDKDGSVPNTPSTLSKDNIPPLDLDSFREEEPVLSEHRFSWPMVQALADEEPVMPYLQKANSYEAPLSPSAYRSYLSHRSLHLDPNLPPSPPVEQDEFLKLNFKEEEASQATVKQLSKRVHWLKKKVKQFEENFEKEHGYRPSHAEKMNHAEMKRTLLELNKLRKDLKNLKEENNLPEPAYLSFSSWSRDSLRGLLDLDDGSAKPTHVMEKALNDTLMSLAEKRRVAQRPDSVDDMTREQVLEEKLALQKALLRFESLHGRPSRRADRNLMRPLYDRYRSVKRLVGRNPLAKGKDSELQPILEHVAMNFTSPQPRSPPQELEEGVEAVPSISSFAQSEADMEEAVASRPEVDEPLPMVLGKCSDSNLHELPLAELLQQQQQSKLEKRRLRKLLKEFEEEFQKQTGRKVQKEDKAPMDSVYCEYKHVKARMRLLEVLVSKHEHRREI